MSLDRSHAGLSFEQAPPITVPIRFFITAPIFGLLIAALYISSGPDALISRWTPEVLAATHLLGLGYISMVMMGAIMQMLPVLVGSPVPRPRLYGAIIHGLVTGGVLVLTASFLLGDGVLLQLAVGLLGSGFLLFVAITLHCLVRAQVSNVTVRGMWLATMSLLVTVVLGITLAEARIGQLGASLSGWWTNLHIAWGFMGWIGILLISIAYEVVPMFQITPQYPTWITNWLAKFIFIGLLVWFALNFVPVINGVVHSLLIKMISIILATGVSLFAIYTLYLQYQRRRRVTDYTLQFWRLGMLSVLVCAVLWISGSVLDWPKRWENMNYFLGIVFFIGVVISVINGMLYKIIPFLVWLHLQGRKNVPSRPPNMKNIIPDRAARWHFRLHLLSLITLMLTLLLLPWLIYPAAILFAVAAMLLFKNIIRALQIYHQVMAE